MKNIVRLRRRVRGHVNMRELPAFSRNGPIFLGPNHQDTDLRIHSRDVLVRRRLRIGGPIEFEAKKFQLAASRSPHFTRVLSNPRAEHERINSSQHGDHGTDARL